MDLKIKFRISDSLERHPPFLEGQGCWVGGGTFIRKCDNILCVWLIVQYKFLKICGLAKGVQNKKSKLLLIKAQNAMTYSSSRSLLQIFGNLRSR